MSLHNTMLEIGFGPPDDVIYTKPDPVEAGCLKATLLANGEIRVVKADAGDKFVWGCRFDDLSSFVLWSSANT